MTEFMKSSEIEDTEPICLKEDCSVQIDINVMMNVDIFN